MKKEIIYRQTFLVKALRASHSDLLSTSLLALLDCLSNLLVNSVLSLLVSESIVSAPFLFLKVFLNELTLLLANFLSDWLILSFSLYSLG